MGPFSFVPALAYLATAVFVVGVALRVLKYARAPMHVRWELYPVPHEKGKEYGGSYFEEVDWWKHPREKHLAGEIKAMLEEMLLIKSLWHHNRAQWYGSFPFHFGLYLLTGLVALLAIGAGTERVLGSASPLAVILQGVAIPVGTIGLAMATFGTIALLYRRASDPVLRETSSFVDYFNLSFLLAVFASADLAWVSGDLYFAQLRAYLGSLLSLSPAQGASALVQLEVALVAMFMIYLPFTHMTHFVAKYFTYHQVRWDDRPNLGEADLQARMMENLGKKVGWSAPHIQSEKSWAEAATEVK